MPRRLLCALSRSLPADQYSAFAYTATSGRARHAVCARIAAADRTAALDALARGAPSPAVTVGASESPSTELPRCVVELPHYPWQRRCYVPQTAAADRAPIAGAPRPSSAPVEPPVASIAPCLLVAQPPPARIVAARDKVRRRVAAVLGHGDPSVVTDGTNFFDLVRPRPKTDPSLRLKVFHHAGGSAAMFHPMHAELPADWELLIIDLPGRGKRYAEPPIQDMPALVERMVEDVRPWLDAPVALFGHSLGAILAAEIGRACESMRSSLVWVGVSGRVAPTLQAQTRRLSALDDSSLLVEVIAMGGTPERVGEIPELRKHFLRIVRADIAALESYQPAAHRTALRCPLTAFAGTSDVWAPPTTMRPWARETRSDFHLRQFEGGHFFFSGPAFAGFTHEIVREIEPCRLGTRSRAEQITSM